MSDTLLALEMCGPTGSVAITAGAGPEARVLAAVSLDKPHSQSERLIGAIDEAVARAGTPLPAIGRLVTCLGPGSFTGLRVAFACLKAIARVTRKPLLAVHASEIRALELFRNQSAKSVVVLSGMTSTRVVRAVFSRDPEGCRLETIATLGPADCGLPDGTPIIGDAAACRLVPAATPAPLDAITVARFAHAARIRETADTAEQLVGLSPLYFGDEHLRKGQR